MLKGDHSALIYAWACTPGDQVGVQPVVLCLVCASWRTHTLTHVYTPHMHNHCGRLTTREVRTPMASMRKPVRTPYTVMAVPHTP